MKLDKHHYLFLFVGFLFLTIVSGGLFSEGMFMDGLLYADISRNMANGLGSFWHPHLSNNLHPEFYEHPPLALGLQSIFFKLFGDSILVERFYSLLTYVLVGYLIVSIWGKLTGDKKTGWVPILLWITMDNVTWAVANNMLENTMSIFVCLSVLLYLKSDERKRFMWIILAGISLACGVLTKGFLCLYIWSIPFFTLLFRREKNLVSAFVDTVILVV
ncbi:MAG: glycosyltransferase family 39 protein, partial [Flavobacteriales bacterium]|nr:glycosyltransferase family 39 protein [Flavobacteriales bacterium]